MAGLVVLSGCGWFSHEEAKAPGPACPAAVILQPLANTAVFVPAAEPRPNNVAFYGLLSEVDSDCSYAAGAVTMKLGVIVIGQRGPAAGNANFVDLDYFVAVIGPEQTILAKKPFAVRVNFTPNQIRAGVTDRIEMVIPLGGRGGRELTLDLGFQQSPQVVEFYKRFRGR